MKEYEQKHIDNFMRDFRDLLRRYNASYKSDGFFESSSCPQIMFAGVPDGDGNVYLLILPFDLPDTIKPSQND
jgi:hypothetical protein